MIYGHLCINHLVNRHGADYDLAAGMITARMLRSTAFSSRYFAPPPVLIMTTAPHPGFGEQALRSPPLVVVTNIAPF